MQVEDLNAGFWHCLNTDCSSDYHRVCRTPCRNDDCDEYMEVIKYMPEGYDGGA